MPHPVPTVARTGIRAVALLALFLSASGSTPPSNRPSEGPFPPPPRPPHRDSAAIAYCGYLPGGAGRDVARGVAVDNAGCVYVAGVTYPGSGWSGQPQSGFVQKVGADGRERLYRMTIPLVRINGIAVDSLGRAVIAGTAFDGNGLAVRGGPDLTFNGGNTDAFVARLSPAGTELEYAGFIGGSAPDGATCVALDVAGNAYVAGGTYSTETTFPVVGGPALQADGMPGEGFVARVNGDTAALDYCGFVSGWHTSVSGIAVDARGCAYICGECTGGAPVKIGPDLTYNGEDTDGFVAKLEADGSGFEYCGYIGTHAGDWEGANAITVDELGHAYVAGYVPYPGDPPGFPVVFGPDLTHNGGESDAWVAKVAEDGTELLFCGFIGGTGNDYAGGIALDSSGNVYVCGYTDSMDGSFPAGGGPDSTYNGGGDAWVAVIRNDGDFVSRSTFLGGAGYDDGLAIAADSRGNVYLAGTTQSDESTFPVRIGPVLMYDRDPENTGDAFVARLAPLHLVRFHAGAGGRLEGPDAQEVSDGEATTPVSALPDPGHIFTLWTGGGGFSSTANPLVITDVAADMEITARFTPFQLTLTGARKHSLSWLARHAYGELQLAIDNPTYVAVRRYVLQRRDGAGDFVSIQEVSGAGPSGDVHTFLDNTLPQSGTSTYRVEARGLMDELLGRSGGVEL